MSLASEQRAETTIVLCTAVKRDAVQIFLRPKIHVRRRSRHQSPRRKRAQSTAKSSGEKAESIARTGRLAEQTGRSRQQSPVRKEVGYRSSVLLNQLLREPKTLCICPSWMISLHTRLSELPAVIPARLRQVDKGIPSRSAAIPLLAWTSRSDFLSCICFSRLRVWAMSTNCEAFLTQEADTQLLRGFAQIPIECGQGQVAP